MKKLIYKFRANCLMILATLFFLTSCNKDLEQLAAIPTPVYPTGKGVAATIAANPNDSLFNRLLVRSGMVSTLNDLTKSFTIFAVDNAGMKIFVNAATNGNIPLTAPDSVFSAFIAGTNTPAVLNLSAAAAGAIVQYNTIGQKFPAATFATGVFPNYPITSLIILDPTQPFVRMPIFPAIGTPYSYVNTIPLVATDAPAANGIIHHTYTIVSPLPASPLTTLKTLINADANLTYFKAAIARGDSGQVGIKGDGPYALKFDSLMNYPVTNMTVLAPNNNACKTVIFGFVYSALVAQGVPPATAAAQATAISSTPAGFNALPVDSVRGIVAYHIFASNNTGSYKPDIRAFSVNFSSAPGAFAKTLVNGSVAIHPGIMAQATFTGPVVSALKFTGYGSFPPVPGAPPYSGTAANATSWDKMALNGVLHVIDRVLFPK